MDNEAISSFGGSNFDYGDNGLPQITTPITSTEQCHHRRDGGAPHFRIFYITNLIPTINYITLQNGFADGTYPGGGSAFPGSGGAIYSDKGP